MKAIFGKKIAIASGALAIALLGGCACQEEQPAPVAEPAPVAAATPVTQTATQTVTESFTLNSEALFDFDKSTLRAENTRALDEAVEKYRGNARLRSMSITGYTDSVGSDAYNQALSERRADAVRDYLVDKGLDGARITASGKGESSPAASNDTAEGRQQNRRVEITTELEREVSR